MATERDEKLWFLGHRLNPRARLRLFCFPYAGKGASVYRVWASELPKEIEVCPVQIPGRENRLKEAPFTDLIELAQTLTPVLQPHLDLPFVFFGHSLGAWLGFEVARTLRRLKLPTPAHLFVSGRRAPRLPDPLSPIHALPEAAFLEALQQRYQGIPAAVLNEPELLQLLLPALRADFTMLETYRYVPESPLDCPISVFSGRDDRVSQAELEAWQDESSRACQVRMLLGGHFFLESARTQFLQMISDELARILGNTS